MKYILRITYGLIIIVVIGGAIALSQMNTSSCNVAHIRLHGQLFTYAPTLSGSNPYESDNIIATSDEIVNEIHRADRDKYVKAILLDIDSGGGSVPAAEEIASALKSAMKPTVAVIRQQGASAAYWAATGASAIFASRNSDIGSIGATFTYLDSAKKNERDGLTYHGLVTGKYKNSGDPNKPLTLDEQAYFQRDLDKIYRNFIEVVSQNRFIDVEQVKALADGSTVLGDTALQDKLIDYLGNIFDAEAYLSNLLKQRIEVCE